MDWMKKHYDRLALALLALVLLACSIALILRVQNFGSAFSAATASAVTREKVPPLTLVAIEEASKTLLAPPQWNEAECRDKDPDNKTRKRGSLFVSDRYVDEGGLPKSPENVSFYKDSLTGKDIPNFWFMDFNLPLLDKTVAQQDPDKDGFSNEEEWRAGTDPTKKESHPAYHTKLYVRQFISIPFQILFQAYDGIPNKDPLDKFTFQINTVLKKRTEFLKLGDMVADTKFKLEKFE